MSKIKIISPVHIASGNVYNIGYVDGENYAYSLETVLMKLAASGSTSEIVSFSNQIASRNISSEGSLLRLLMDNSGSRYRPIFGFGDKSYYNVENSINKKKYFNREHIGKNVSEAVKTLDKLYIPGSSLKGYIINVAWNCLISENEKVRKFFLDRFATIKVEFQFKLDRIVADLQSDNQNIKREAKNNLRNILRDIKRHQCSKEIDRLMNNSDGIKKIQETIGVRDIIFSDEFDIEFTSRFHRREQVTIPTNNVEVIRKDEEAEGDFFFFPCEYDDGIVAQALKLCGNDEVGKEVVSTFAKYFKDFKNWFPRANKRFISTVITYERDFISHSQNDKINKTSLNSFYDKIEALLNEGRVIIRIGKNTNYILKTFGSSFEREYHNYFKYIFSPVVSYDKFKAIPNILTSTLRIDDNKGVEPFGYAVIEL